MNQPKERPILFKGEMVNAILDGRKWKTRRAMKVQPPEGHYPSDCPYNESGWALWKIDGCCTCVEIKCPYGKPGDRLWVREAWAAHFIWDSTAPSRIDYDDLSCIFYHADNSCTGGCQMSQRGKWRPSIHMPRAASRILLEITDVRVERLQDISEEDAKAEGVSADCPIGHIPSYQKAPFSYCFASLWESINGADSWDANPWVWVVEFKRVDSDHFPDATKMIRAEPSQ